ncbi:glycosyltransferase 87 family protein [Streptomyces sp. MST-110588]|uniref:glycosyltransferase 87 family protein n=1 Tax=Streptomyces sp. MST-110588 TaxID=2833628 RepID=UPI001F5DDDD9|nr:glycosyltransferase 87 family protein [Streptomyces sp. MST-110588]
MTALELEQPADARAPSPLRAFVRRRPVACATLACLVSFAAFWTAQRLAHVTMIDLMVYRAEGWTARNGEDLYDMVATSANLPNTYPPFAALLFTPLTLVGVREMQILATLGNLLLLVAVVHLSLRLAGLPRARPRTADRGGLRVTYGTPRLAATLALSAVLVWCEPVWTTLRYGQINLLLAVLVLWDMTRKDTNRWAGAGIGVAAGIKLTPALFAVLLALAGLVRAGQRLRTGRGRGPRTDGPGGVGDPAPGGPRSGGGVRMSGGPGSPWNPWLRQATVATLTFLATVVVSAVALPGDSRRFWTEIVFAADRVGEVEITANQSLRGALARLLHTHDPGLAWLVVAALAAAFGLAVTVTALLHGRRAWASVACAATALLVSPVSWSHHWVWCVPMVILLGSQARRRAAPAGRPDRRWWVTAGVFSLLFCSYALWWVPHRWHQHEELHQNAGQMLLSGGYQLAGLAFLLLAARQVFRPAFRRTGNVPDSRPPAGR